MRTCAILLAAILALLPAGGRTGGGRPGDPPGGHFPADPESAASCGECHVEIHREWASAAHARAWTDPIYQRALKGKERPELCHGCHIPGRVLDRLGKRPRTRDVHLDEGVTCVSCHKQGEAIHGPFGATTVAHASVKDPIFTEKGSIALCSSCHSTRIADVLPLARDFEEAQLAARGKSCVGCHMPDIERPLAVDPASGQPTGPRRWGRSHAILGPGDPAFCAEAFGFSLLVQGGRLFVEVLNKAGHRIPGLVGLRAFPMRFRQLDTAGRTLHEGAFTVSSDNPLLVDETRRVEFPLREGMAAVQVAVEHVFQGKVMAQVIDRRLEPK